LAPFFCSNPTSKTTLHMKKAISEYRTFFREFRQTFHTTGAIAPSGRVLARAVVKPLSCHQVPVRVLEVGSGTGAVSKEIVKQIRPGDWFDLVELNDRFVSTLRHRFATEPDFQRVADQCEVLHRAVQEVSTDTKYDYIICGVPFNNFPISLVKEILRHMSKLLRPGGTLSFFEYLWIRRFKSLLANRDERRRLGGVGVVIERYLSRYEFQCDTAWINFPPAMVHHLRVESSNKLESDGEPTARTIRAGQHYPPLRPGAPHSESHHARRGEAHR